MKYYRSPYGSILRRGADDMFAWWEIDYGRWGKQHDNGAVREHLISSCYPIPNTLALLKGATC